MGKFVSYWNQSTEESAKFIDTFRVESFQAGREIFPIQVVMAKDVDYIIEEEGIEWSRESTWFDSHTGIGIFNDRFLQHEVAVGVLFVKIIIAE